MFLQGEISRLDQRVSAYSRENEALHARLKQNVQGTTAENTAADNAVLKVLTNKLEKMTERYNEAMKEVENMKKVSVTLLMSVVAATPYTSL